MPDARFVYIRLIRDAQIKTVIKPNKYKANKFRFISASKKKITTTLISIIKKLVIRYCDQFTLIAVYDINRGG